MKKDVRKRDGKKNKKKEGLKELGKKRWKE